MDRMYVIMNEIDIVELSEAVNMIALQYVNNQLIPLIGDGREQAADFCVMIPKEKYQIVQLEHSDVDDQMIVHIEATMPIEYRYYQVSYRGNDQCFRSQYYLKLKNYIKKNYSRTYNCREYIGLSWEQFWKKNRYCYKFHIKALHKSFELTQDNWHLLLDELEEKGYSCLKNGYDIRKAQDIREHGTEMVITAEGEKLKFWLRGRKCYYYPDVEGVFLFYTEKRKLMELLVDERILLSPAFEQISRIIELIELKVLEFDHF